MAKVTLNPPSKPVNTVKYSELLTGSYILGTTSDVVYAVVYNSHTPSRPILSEVKNPSVTFTGGLPSVEPYRYLTEGESFSVTI